MATSSRALVTKVKKPRVSVEGAVLALLEKGPLWALRIIAVETTIFEGVGGPELKNPRVSFEGAGPWVLEKGTASAELN
jgi:hypothetical protein